MAVLLQESLADATCFDQHDDFVHEFSLDKLQTSFNGMEHTTDDFYKRTCSGKEMLASAISPMDSDPKAPQSCFQSIDNVLGLSQEEEFLPPAFTSHSDDYRVECNLGQQEPFGWCEALDSSGDTCSAIDITSQPVDDFVDLLQSEYSFPWNDGQFDIPGTMISPSANAITDYSTPDMTDSSTPTYSSTCQNSPLSVGTSTSDFKTDNQRWHATQSRLRAADQSFLYGVLTTKIFCRPSCASRRPSRRHVRFFPFPGAIQAAEQANFRPCKRCHPELLGTTNTAVLGICQVLRNIIAEANKQDSTKDNKNAFKLETLAQSAGLSTFHFHRLFKATTQVTPGDFIAACRALALQDTLGKDRNKHENATSRTVNQVALTTNLSPSWSPRTARKALGNLSPTAYAKGAPSTIISHCCVDGTPCGRICIAFSNSNSEGREMNVHAVLIGPDAETRICLRFPDSTASERHSSALEKCVRSLGEEVRDRDTELADDVLLGLWRARVWLRLGEFWGSQEGFG
ncbi:hypothetical protein JMJ35_008455 [Cladonia borealis]|uniref:HTH araC/xylS-type domain-containing protein n=1 Tax=Cladonia borealis TaxID=184061 RepID=A0AA39V2U0_9LECA|nr:hypothetical protein JMJ35_008455 [Cladonia borealis]